MKSGTPTTESDLDTHPLPGESQEESQEESQDSHGNMPETPMADTDVATDGEEDSKGKQKRKPNSDGFKAFRFLLWGQGIALLGSALTAFGLSVWVYQQVGRVTDFALVSFAASAPRVLLGPLAGAVVDRFRRKTVLLVGQIAQVLVTLAMALLYWYQMLEVWHIMALAAAGSVFSAFVLPALNSSLPLMVEDGELPMANGMMGLLLGLVQVAAPAIAGGLLLSIGLEGLFAINLVAFVFGFAALLMTVIPNPPHSDEQKGLGLAQGFDYLWRHKGLLGLAFYISLISFVTTAVTTLITPMVLGFSDAQGLGNLLSICGIGMVVGSGLIMAWGGPDRKVLAVFGGSLIVALACLFSPLSTNIYWVAIGGVLIAAAFPVATTCLQTIYQRKVQLDIQGRVFGVRMFMMGAATLTAPLVVGPLVDQWLQPALINNQWPELTQLYGISEGRGAAVLISLLGAVLAGLTLLALLVSPIRRIDIDMPNLNEEKKLVKK